jgi:hypothetical protein
MFVKKRLFNLLEKFENLNQIIAFILTNKNVDLEVMSHDETDEVINTTPQLKKQVSLKDLLQFLNEKNGEIFTKNNKYKEDTSNGEILNKKYKNKIFMQVAQVCNQTLISFIV